MKEDSRLEGGEYKGYRISVKLVRNGKDLYNPKMLTNPEEVYDFLKEIQDLDREVFYSIHLDNKNRIISCEEISKGSLSGTIVHPREVYKAAILNSASGIIVAHNHPSGEVDPSNEDMEVTKRLYESGEILGIPLKDSIIIGDGKYYSAKEHEHL